MDFAVGNGHRAEINRVHWRTESINRVKERKTVRNPHLINENQIDWGVQPVINWCALVEDY